jgi:formimidoylglutamate deiminase
MQSENSANPIDPPPKQTLWSPRAWIDGRWQENVSLQVGDDGHWLGIHTGTTPGPEAIVLAGPVLPGLVNAHSHSFQRAFAGLAERRDLDQDDFWSWRDGMYRTALRITPELQGAIAAQLFLELARGGFTHICEFHYLHNDGEGLPYPGDPACMARSIADAARQVGLGLTLLPTVYERAGFAQANLREDQRRFRADAETVLAMRDALRRPASAGAGAAPTIRVGLALHSLRAASAGAILRLAEDGDSAPIHIHIAEQAQEIDDCLNETGLRPVAWLCRHAALDRRWQLVHATHTTGAEIDAIARSGAGVVLCPSTEANLGDGLTDLTGWLRHGVPIALGTDSHVTRSAMEEFRLLEYGQRLARRVRCVGADPQHGEPSTAARLWSRALDGGAAAAGFDRWGLQVRARADLLVIDMRAAALLGVPDSHLLDALMFSSPVRPFRDVLVAGRWVMRDHRSTDSEGIAGRFVDAMKQIRLAATHPGK